MEMHNAYADTAAATSIVTTSETVVATLANNVTVPQGVLVVLEGIIAITTGAATNQVNVRVRRGTTIAGAVVGVAIPALASPATFTAMPFQVSDTPGEVAGASYVLTVQQNAATSNGTMSWASIQATWLS